MDRYLKTRIDVIIIYFILLCIIIYLYTNNNNSNKDCIWKLKKIFLIFMSIFFILKINSNSCLQVSLENNSKTKCFFQYA